MKLDRRSFLSFVVGGAAGAALSPLPWKMMDDSAIWTQNWPWTPVPPDGKVTYTDSTCTLCPGGCGISVRKVGDRLIKIEGKSGHPVNDGRVCILGVSGLQLLYGPGRIKTPLKRTGKRGEGKWERMSWKDAVGYVVTQLKDIRSKSQSETLACISGSDQGITPRLLQRFLSAFGSPNFIHVPSIYDAYKAAATLSHGKPVLPGFDFEHSDFILSFGSGILEGWGNPVQMFRTNSLWKDKGVRVVQVEPRLSNTAAKAQQWVPINPGTEAALALGMAHVMIDQSMYDKDFVDNHTSGFESLKQAVLDSCSPDKVEKITGIDKHTIISLAKDFAKASRPIAICGRGQGKTPPALNEVMAVNYLNALKGNMSKKGSIQAVLEPSYINWPDVETDSIAQDGMKKKRIDGAGSKYPLVASSMDRLPEMINSESTSPVNLLLVSGANPVYSMPDTRLVKKAFDKIPFIVSFSSFMDETAENSDLILPNHVYLERYEDVLISSGLQEPYIGLAKPVSSPMFDTKHTADVIIDIAKAMEGSISASFSWTDYNDCLKATFGDKWDTLEEKGYISASCVNSEGAPCETDAEKFVFANSSTVSDIASSLINAQGDEKTFPLLLVPYDSMRLASGYIGDPPFVIKTVEDTVLQGKDSLVEINPETAKSLRLSEGKYAVLTTPKGSVKVKVHLYDGIMPGVIAMPRGLGHTAGGKYLAGKGININELIGAVEDPASGLNVAWGIRAAIEKV
jgi:anaerobic selenocysteine-containing dehydrogenase